MVLIEYRGGGQDTSMVFRYKLSGSTGLELRQQIDPHEQRMFPTSPGSRLIIIEGTEVYVYQAEFVSVFKRVD